MIVSMGRHRLGRFAAAVGPAAAVAAVWATLQQKYINGMNAALNMGAQLPYQGFQQINPLLQAAQGQEAKGGDATQAALAVLGVILQYGPSTGLSPDDLQPVMDLQAQLKQAANTPPSGTTGGAVTPSGTPTIPTANALPTLDPSILGVTGAPAGTTTFLPNQGTTSTSGAGLVSGGSMTTAGGYYPAPPPPGVPLWVWLLGGSALAVGLGFVVFRKKG